MASQDMSHEKWSRIWLGRVLRCCGRRSAARWSRSDSILFLMFTTEGCSTLYKAANQMNRLTVLRSRTSTLQNSARNSFSFKQEQKKAGICFEQNLCSCRFFFGKKNRARWQNRRAGLKHQGLWKTWTRLEIIRRIAVLQKSEKTQSFRNPGLNISLRFCKKHLQEIIVFTFKPYRMVLFIFSTRHWFNKKKHIVRDNKV